MSTTTSSSTRARSTSTADRGESPRPGAGFADLGVPAPLVKALVAQGITAPFPIQAATLTDTLAGRDVLGRGRTGSGKTLAFSLPALTRLAAAPATRRAGRPRALVLAPTRELANQITATIEPLAAATGLRVTTIFGGVSQGRQVTALNRGVDVVVACPGRLEDLMQQGHVRLDAVEISILDEADHMADLGFLPGVRRILRATPVGIQRMLFSATLDQGVDVLVKQFLRDPAVHAVDPEQSPVVTMTHHVLAVASPQDKTVVVRELAGGQGRRILFTRTKHAAKKLARQLTAAGIPAVDLHGNLSQAARERNLAAFSGDGVRVLVATDIAARGIHVDDIDLVIHVDPPAEHKAYLHRSGRTARAGSAGTVVTVMLPDQAKDVRTLLRQADLKVAPVTVTPGDTTVSTLAGPPAARVEPTAAPVASLNGQRSAGGGGSHTAGRRRGSRGGSRTGGGRAGAASSAPGHSTPGSSAPTKGGRSAGGQGGGRGAGRPAGGRGSGGRGAGGRTGGRG